MSKPRKTKSNQISTDQPMDTTMPKVFIKYIYFNLLALGGICALGVLLYMNSLSYTFHYDDNHAIVDNLKIRELGNLKTWFNFSNSRPISYYSFALNYHFNQLDLKGYHIVNILIHLLNSLLVFFISLLIFKTPALKQSKLSFKARYIALITGLLFVSHPLATQAVTYIVQRMASLVALFYFLSIFAFIKGRLTENSVYKKLFWFTICLVSAIAAFLTKENSYTLPAAILLIEFCFMTKDQFRLNINPRKFVFVLVGFIVFIILLYSKYSFTVFQPVKPSGSFTQLLTPFNYLYTQFFVILKYVQLLFIPLNQMLDYDIKVSDSILEIRTLLCLFVNLCIIAFAIFQFNKQRLISFGIFWFYLCLSVESSIIPINDVIFEHRTYLPSFGFFLVFIIAIFSYTGDKYKSLPYLIFALIIGVNSYLTYKRNQVWKDDLSLWNDNVKKAPGLARPICNRGWAYRNLNQWDKALDDYSKALKINPNYTVALLNRGAAYSHFEQWNKAVQDFSKAILLDPNYTNAYSNRGAAYTSLKEYDKAIDDYTKAIELEPNFYLTYFNRGITYAGLNMWNKAIEDYSTAIRINANYTPAYNNRAIAYGALNEWNKAISDYTKVLSMNKNSEEAYFNRAGAFKSLGEWQKSIEDYTAAVSLNKQYAKAYYNRGIVYAQLQDWNKAIEDYTLAIQVDQNYKQAYVNRGNAYGNINLWNKAIEDYKSAIKIDPNFTIAVNNQKVALGKLKSNKRN